MKVVNDVLLMIFKINFFILYIKCTILSSMIIWIISHALILTAKLRASFLSIFLLKECLMIKVLNVLKCSSEKSFNSAFTESMHYLAHLFCCLLFVTNDQHIQRLVTPEIIYYKGSYLT